MKLKVKLPKEAKELTTSVSDVLDLGRQAVEGGSRALRQAKKTARTVSGILAGAKAVARAGREAASRLRPGSHPGKNEGAEDESGNVIIDLRRRDGGGAPEGDKS